MSDYWTVNGIEKPQQIVVCAACRDPIEGFIITGPRHWDSIMRKQMAVYMRAYGVVNAAGWEQGFVDQFGDFLTREEAMEIVKANGQPFNLERNGRSDKTLFSEGLY